LLPPEGDGQYRQFITEARIVNPSIRFIGLTATPYRTRTGDLCGPNEILGGVCYEAPIKRLMDEGFLCPMIGKTSTSPVDTSRISTLGGEFMNREMEDKFNVPEVVEAACKEICSYTMDRKGVLVFTSGVDHGINVTATLARMTQEPVEFVCGETSSLERLRIINGFKNQEFRILVNPNLLTTGFNAKHVDAIAILRATLSPGLFAQMCGRGLRTHPAKKSCLILDFGQNLMRHGPIDAIKPPHKPGGDGEAPSKECPECHSVVAAAAKECPDCGYIFPFEEKPIDPRHERTASTESPLKQPPQKSEIWLDIQDVHYALHKKKNAPPDAPRTLRVEYEVNLTTIIREWICLEHEGYTRAKAVAWWVSRSLDRRMGAPTTIEEAVAIANSGGLAFPRRILVQETEGERFPRVIEAELEWPQDRPEEEEPAQGPAGIQDDSDIPF
jgi:DNA repair protein RadD